MNNKFQKSLFCVALTALISLSSNAKSNTNYSNDTKIKKCTISPLQMKYGIISICSKSKSVDWKPYLKGASLFAELNICDKVRVTLSNEKDNIEVASTGKFLLKIHLPNNSVKAIEIKKGVTKFSLKSENCNSKKNCSSSNVEGEYTGKFAMTDSKCVSCHATASIKKESDHYLLNFIVYKKGKQLIYKLKSKDLNINKLQFVNHKFSFTVKNGKIEGDLIKKDECIAKASLHKIEKKEVAVNKNNK